MVGIDRWYAFFRLLHRLGLPRSYGPFQSKTGGDRSNSVELPALRRSGRLADAGVRVGVRPKGGDGSV